MGAAMGWTASETKSSSMWEFFSSWRGFVEANTPKGGEKLSEAEKDDLWADVDSYGRTGPRTLTTRTYNLDGMVLVPVRLVTFTIDD